jgi:hypothetical protein
MLGQDRRGHEVTNLRKGEKVEIPTGEHTMIRLTSSQDRQKAVAIPKM